MHLSSHLRGSSLIRNENASKRPFPDCAIQTNLCSLPSANSLIQKCVRIHVPNSKYLRSKKPQSESCCLSKFRYLQTESAYSLETSVGRSMRISARCTQVERSRTKMIKVMNRKPLLVNQQCVAYYFQCSLGDAGYVCYAYRRLHQRIEKHKGSAIGNHLREQHNIAPNGTVWSFKILRKCQNKLDCLIFVPLFLSKNLNQHLINSMIPSAQNYLFRSVLSKPCYCFIVSLFYVLFLTL